MADSRTISRVASRSAANSLIFPAPIQETDESPVEADGTEEAAAEAEPGQSEPQETPPETDDATAESSHAPAEAEPMQLPYATQGEEPSGGTGAPRGKTASFARRAAGEPDCWCLGMVCERTCLSRSALAPCWSNADAFGNAKLISMSAAEGGEQLCLGVRMAVHGQRQQI